MGNKISNLLSRIVVLESCFDSRPSDVAEQRRRDDLIRCGPLFLLYFLCSFPPRKLEAIEEQLRLFSEKSGLLLSADNVQASKDAFRLLEDIQEAILDYQVRSRPDALLNVNGGKQTTRQTTSNNQGLRAIVSVPIFVWANKITSPRRIQVGSSSVFAFQ